MLRLRDRLIKGTVLNFIAVAFNQGSTLIVNIIVARILLKQTFGEYAMVQSTLLTVSALSQLATGYTASKYIAEYRSSDPQRAGRIMGLCALVSVVMAGFGTFLLIAMAPWLAGTMLNAPHLASALMIGSGFLFFSSINGYQTGALSGLEAYGGLAKAGVASGIVAVVAIALGAWWGGLNGTLVGLSISALVRCAIHKRWLRLESQAQGIKPQYRGSFSQEKSIIFKFALPAALAGYYSMPMIWLANSFLVRQLGGYGEMALYSAANNLRILVLFLPTVMNSVGLSVLNNEQAKGDMSRYNRIFRSNVLSLFLVSLSGALIMGVLGRPMLQLFGKDFEAGHFLLWFLLVSSVFEGLSIALYQYVQSKAKIWLSFFSINVPREAFLVVAAYYLVQPYGGVGLAAAYLGANILWVILQFSLVAILYRKE
ncbi:MAG: oligosaccharide flippase family protein [Kiritimatiellae bacterium]|nr:oligosaccharide flippase family protein [Kiritimatiellia bacterium]MDD5521802.1 oligosaccharide flippase family protein [Kiritimatiellia bacterium]